MGRAILWQCAPGDGSQNTLRALRPSVLNAPKTEKPNGEDNLRSAFPAFTGSIHWFGAQFRGGIEPPPALTAPALTAPALTAPALTAPALTAPALTAIKAEADPSVARGI